jgi:hypothetical protein
VSGLSEEARRELRRFGWKLGGDFERRYASDPWVFNLVNALEVVVRERDAALAPDLPEGMPRMMQSRFPKRAGEDTVDLAEGAP